MRTGRPGVLVQLDGGVPVKKCPMCEEVLPLSAYATDKSKTDGRTSYCKTCRNNGRKLRRRLGLKEKRFERDPQKDIAKNLLKKALRMGLITKPETCDVCGGGNQIEGHHVDYSDPYTVAWLCKDCHAFVHSQAYKNFRKKF